MKLNFVTRAACLPALAAAGFPLASAASQVTATAPAERPFWREMLNADLALIKDTLQNRYIYAVYPGGQQWGSIYEPAARAAEEAVAEVENFAGYRAVLLRFVNTFNDPHLRIGLDIQLSRYRWPGFAVRYSGGKILVRRSAVPGVDIGAELTSCDGREAVAMLDELARLEGGVPGTHSSREEYAPRLLVDAKNPFFRPPTRCRVGAADITLSWTNAEPEVLSDDGLTVSSVPAGLSEFGRDGAWIRLPFMSARNPDEVAAYQRVIDAAPRLRDKAVIVFDVRGNPGGPYNWFMAILRSLYGDDFVRHHARERLRIRPVFVGGTINIPSDPGARARMGNPPGMPADPQLGASVAHVREIDLPSGRQIIVMEPSPDAARLRQPARLPASPVRGRVYVLADHGCKSACISFLDEIRQFPGVQLIGTHPGVDLRSGTSATYTLPSGNGALRAATMVRENRARGENEMIQPHHLFPGEVSDTEAVRRWIREELLPRAAANVRGG